MQSGEQGVHGVIIHVVTPTHALFDLERLADYALQAEDLLPLVQTLESDLSRASQELSKLLQTHADGPSLHLTLHALKGMAGMFARPSLHEAITLADDVCRRGESSHGSVLAQGLSTPIQQWLAEVQEWLRSYS